MAETAHDAFKRVSVRRVNRVLYDLRVLSNVANRAIYDYDDQEVDKMFGVIDKQLELAKGRFKQPDAAKFMWEPDEKQGQ
jgi:hypothetical protein